MGFLERTELLLGPEKLAKLASAHVLVLGVGGVGAYAAEMLVRAGLGEITIIDGDIVEESNRNRQLVALCSTVGQPKVEVLRQRLLDINPDCRVHAVFDFIADEKIDLLCAQKFTCAIDAIDTLSPKAFFLAACLKHNLPVISSMGSGGRLDPTKVEITRLDKTYNCGLARALRKRLQKMNVSTRIDCVFSSEPVPPEAVRPGVDGNGKSRSTTGTVSYLPAVFGCTLAAAAIRKMLS